ncbi:MAG: hypothetical protein H7Y86_14370 [Rhizobacter sp.]|nr:hypothetical protein [Ferruginibacter sp.]
MQKILLPSLLLMLVASLSSCELVGDIFQAGFSVGIFVVVAIVAIILFFVFRARK